MFKEKDRRLVYSSIHDRITGIKMDDPQDFVLESKTDRCLDDLAAIGETTRSNWKT